MTDNERDALMGALITEAVSLTALLVMLWVLAHKTDLEHWWWRFNHRAKGESDVEAAFRQARRGLHDEIRRMEYGLE